VRQHTCIYGLDDAFIPVTSMVGRLQRMYRWQQQQQQQQCMHVHVRAAAAAAAAAA
jgi:hypothetical protein